MKHSLQIFVAAGTPTEKSPPDQRIIIRTIVLAHIDLVGGPVWGIPTHTIWLMTNAKIGTVAGRTVSHRENYEGQGDRCRNRMHIQALERRRGRRTIDGRIRLSYRLDRGCLDGRPQNRWRRCERCLHQDRRGADDQVTIVQPMTHEQARVVLTLVLLLCGFDQSLYYPFESSLCFDSIGASRRGTSRPTRKGQ